MNFVLTEEQEMMRQMVRDFAEKEVKPGAAERDEQAQFSRKFSIKWASWALPAYPGRKNMAGRNAIFSAMPSPWRSFPGRCGGRRYPIGTYFTGRLAPI